MAIDQKEVQKSKKINVAALELANFIAARLGEDQPGPKNQINYIVRTIGKTEAKRFLQKTIEIEKNGGELLPDGSRHRTLGGIFFRLVYTEGKAKPGKVLQRYYNYVKVLSPEERKQQQEAHRANINAEQNGKKQIRSQNDVAQIRKHGQKKKEKPFSLLTWETRQEAVQEAMNEKGKTVSEKIMLSGRPGPVARRDGCVITVLESSKVPTNLPKGLPTPTSDTTKYAVYISNKHWAKVESALMRDKEDILVIEGFPRADKAVTAIAIFATNVTTRNLSIAKKEEQRQKVQETQS